MQRDKVSEKVIWENFNPREDSVSVPEPTVTSAAFVQPKMMFCWKCGKTIPSDSKFCPWCQIELFTSCPKCGNKYSSQYPFCNQCGTNKKEYLIALIITDLQKQKEALQVNTIKNEEKICQQKKLEYNRRIEGLEKTLKVSSDQSLTKILLQNYMNDEYRKIVEDEAKRRVREAYLKRKKELGK